MCFFVELQESHEQHLPPAEDDGDSVHEQRLPGEPAATSAGVSSGSKQRWVGLKMHKYAFYLCPIFENGLKYEVSLYVMLVCVLCREKKDSKRWCATCNTHFTCSIMDHHHSEEHKVIMCSLYR